MSKNNADEKKLSTSLLVKSSFWYTLSGFLTRAISFITIPIFTRILSKEQIGDFSVFASWQAILLIICSIEVQNTVNKARFDFPEEHQLNAYVTSCLVLSTVLTAVVGGLYLLFPHLFYRVLLIDRKYMGILFLYLFTVPAFTMFHTVQRVKYRYKLSAGITLCVVLLSSVLAVLLAVSWTEDRLFGRIFGQYILHIVTGLLFYVYFAWKSFRIKKVYFQYALRIGLPLVFSYLGGTILLASDSLVAKHMCTDAQVGYIALVHSAAHIILILVQTMNSAWSPWFYDKLNLGHTAPIRKAFRAYIWLVLLGTFAVVLLGPEIILILGGREYSEAVAILPPVVLSGAFTVLTAQMGNLETYYKKPEAAAAITGIVAVVNIVLNIVGVLLWDYRAVCYVTVACTVLSVLIHYRYTKRMNIREMIRPSDLAQFMLAALLMIPVALLLYLNFTVRIVFIALLLVLALILAYVKRKLILEWIRRLKERAQ